jgi:hypothetical protein
MVPGYRRAHVSSFPRVLEEGKPKSEMIGTKDRCYSPEVRADRSTTEVSGAFGAVPRAGEVDGADGDSLLSPPRPPGPDSPPASSITSLSNCSSESNALCHCEASSSSVLPAVSPPPPMVLAVSRKGPLLFEETEGVRKGREPTCPLVRKSWWAARAAAGTEGAYLCWPRSCKVVSGMDHLCLSFMASKHVVSNDS